MSRIASSNATLRAAATVARRAWGWPSCVTSFRLTADASTCRARWEKARASRWISRRSEMPAILVVDDEKNIRAHLASYLRGQGYTTETAASAADALTALRSRRFDLVLSDVRMTGMDGLALLAELRRTAPETTVVLMTAYATVSQAVEAMRAGAQDYVVKPFSLDEIKLVVERALEVQTLRRENRRLRQAVEEPVLLESHSPTMQAAL